MEAPKSYEQLYQDLTDLASKIKISPQELVGALHDYLDKMQSEYSSMTDQYKNSVAPADPNPFTSGDVAFALAGASGTYSNIPGAPVVDLVAYPITFLEWDGSTCTKSERAVDMGGYVSLPDLAEKLKDLKLKEEITQFDKINEGFYLYNAAKNEGYYDVVGWDTVLIDVNEGEEWEYNSSLGGSSVAAIVFYASDGANLGYASQGNNQIVEGLIVTIPVGVTQMLYTTKTGYSNRFIAKLVGGIDRAIKNIEEQTDQKFNSITTEQLLQDLSINENKNFINQISEEIIKNIYHGDELNGYVNSNGEFSPTTGELYKTTGIFKVKPNTYYCISNRLVFGASNIRCLDSNQENPSKVRIASTGLEYSSWYTPNEEGTGLTSNGQIKTSPTAEYLQFNILFNSDLPDYNKVMVEEVGSVYDPNFIPSPYEPYNPTRKIKKTALPEDDTILTKKVSIHSTPMFLLVGASFGEGYGSVKDKSFVSYLSALLDWNVENYSQTGSDNIEQFNQIVKLLDRSNVHPKDISNGGYALITLGGNEAEYITKGIDAKYFKENIIRLCSALKSYGFIPILGSYFGDQRSPWNMVQRSISIEMNIPFMDINGYTRQFYWPIYKPWWYNAHYATRSNAQQWYNYLKLLRNIQRPNTGLKIFRNRITSTNLDDFLFDSNIEKMKMWRELSLHHQALKNEFNKYVDRQDLLVWTDSNGDKQILPALDNIESEYQRFRNGEELIFNDKALFQFVLSAVGKSVNSLKLLIETLDDVSIYARQYIDPSLEINLSDANAAYHIINESINVVIGDTYSDTDNPGVVFTVAELSENTLIMTPNGAFEVPGNTTGTLTRISGTGDTPLNYDKLTKAPGQNYFSTALSKKGKWSLLNGIEGEYKINTPENYLDFDRLDILVVGTGEFSITDISAEYIQVQEKPMLLMDNFKALALQQSLGNQLLSKTKFDNPIIDWNAPSGVYVWNGQQQYTDANGILQTGKHIPSYFEIQKGITKITRLMSGEQISQAVNMLGEQYKSKSYHLKIIARYYPTEAIDVNNLPNDVRTPNTFDFGKIELSWKITGDSYYSQTIHVPLSFVEIEQEIFFDSDDSTMTDNEIRIKAIDDRIELLMVELYD